MKKNYIIKQIGLVIICMLVFYACSPNKQAPHQEHGKHMDPAAFNLDSGLSDLLQPSNEQVVSSLPVIKAEYGTKIFVEETQGLVTYDTRSQNRISSRVSGRIERLLIRYNYQPVKKGQLIMEIYSPELAAAQQELLYLNRSSGDQNLLAAARQRLLLLGMTASAINRVLQTGRVNYRVPVYSGFNGYILEQPVLTTSAGNSAAEPSAGGDGMGNMGSASSGSSVPAANQAPVNTPVLLREGQYVRAGQSLFSVYDASRLIAEFSFKPALAAWIKKGNKIVFYKTADKNTAQTAAIDLIQPVIENAGNFTKARVYLRKAGFRAGELLTGKVPIQIPSSWWLPEKAFVSLGNQKVVFKKEGSVMVPKILKTGVTINGLIQVKENISNWELSSHAAFLVDSESFIEARIKN